MGLFTIRKAQQRDIYQLNRLMQAYIVDFYKYPRPQEESLLALIEILLQGKEGIQFVAEQDDKLIGFATLYFSYSTIQAKKIVIMNDLYVVEDMRGHQVGSGLFQACHNYQLTHHYASMLWETASSNHRAQSFYEKMGAEAGNWVTYSLGGE